MEGDKPLTVAAVDLGSNSFHLLIARVVEQDLQIVDRMREPLCLAGGLDSGNRLSDEVQRTAVECLERVGQRLRTLPQGHVRAVGTNTLRLARNAREFLGRARQALGHSIEVVSGQEEARLIYLGVAHSHFSPTQRLIVDIGGGSTEVILGEGFEILTAHSLFMGCVNYSRRFFPRGDLRKDRFRKAEIAARLEMRAIEARLRSMGWDACIGASGTVQAIHEMLQASGWSDGTITLPALKRLRRALIDAGSVEELALPALKPDRARVLPGGLAILIGIFKSLRIESMSACSGALREGVLYDLVGRIRHEDVRDSTIRRLVQQYHVDLMQSSRVERTALNLLKQIGPPLDDATARKLLIWTSRLHETGLAVSHTGFQKHGAYLVTHSDMPGFSADDQLLLAALIRGHRRKIARSAFEGLSSTAGELALRLCVIFRLAVLLNRGRVKEQNPALACSADWSALVVSFPAGWIRDHPMTVADLEQETAYLEPLGVELVLEEQQPSTLKKA